MKIFWITLISIFLFIFISGSVLFFVGYFRPKPAGLSLQTSVPAAAYINGDFVGRTPLEISYKSGNIDLKLVPLDPNKSYIPFETQISLTSGVKTIVRRIFADNDFASSGQIVTLDKESGSEAFLSVISKPENAQIALDGVSKGFSPVKIQVSPGTHQLVIKSPGYSDMSLSINTVSGYKLTVSAQLSKLAIDPSPSPVPETQPQIFVEILPTPTGYLRVRTQPGVNGTEIDQIKPGSKYLLLSEDPTTHWFQIQLEPPVPGLPQGRSGWISNDYAKKIEISESASLVSSPAPTVLPNY